MPFSHFETAPKKESFTDRQSVYIIFGRYVYEKIGF